MNEYKTCTKCKQTKILDYFYADNSRIDKKHPYCKKCQRANNQNYRLKNPDAVRQGKYEWALRNREKRRNSAKKWARNNRMSVNNVTVRYRARKKNADNCLVTTRDLRKLLSNDCLYCGKPSTQIDHIIPISRGGRHSIGNLIGACAPCNQSKSAKLIMEWKKVRGW